MCFCDVSARFESRLHFEYLKAFAQRNAAMTIEDAANNEEVLRKAPSEILLNRNNVFLYIIRIYISRMSEAMECRHSTRGKDRECRNIPTSICAVDGRLRCSLYQMRHMDRKPDCSLHYSSLAKVIEIKSTKNSALSHNGVQTKALTPLILIRHRTQS